MARNDKIQFINQFIDAVTVRPFFDDLRRLKRASSRHNMPVVVGRAPRTTHEAA